MKPQDDRDLKLFTPRENEITEPLQRESRGQDPAQIEELIEELNLDEHQKKSARDMMLAVPRRVRFRWQDRGDARYDLILARDRSFQTASVASGLKGNEHAVTNLWIGSRYFWKVVARRRGRILARSRIRSFRIPRSQPRWILAPGVYNMRDMGGWPAAGGRRIRQGLVYRSGAITSIQPEGIEVLARDLGVRTDLNLRRGGVRTIQESVVSWVNTPVRGYHRGVLEVSDDDGQWEVSYLRAFRVLSQPRNYPLVFHCAAGADRAGTVAFLLGALLGMDIEDLRRDYELTTRAGTERSAGGANFRALQEAVSGFGPEEMGLKEKVEHYLLVAGLSRESIGRIRELLLE